MKLPMVYQMGGVRTRGHVRQYRAEIPAMSANYGMGGQNVPAIDLGSGIRYLTPLECERLQGFEDNWTEGESDTQRYKMLGNAVSTPMSYIIAERLADKTL